MSTELSIAVVLLVVVVNDFPIAALKEGLLEIPWNLCLQQEDNCQEFNSLFVYLGEDSIDMWSSDCCLDHLLQQTQLPDTMLDLLNIFPDTREKVCWMRFVRQTHSDHVVKSVVSVSTLSIPRLWIMLTTQLPKPFINTITLKQYVGITGDSLNMIF